MFPFYEQVLCICTLCSILQTNTLSGLPKELIINYALHRLQYTPREKVGLLFVLEPFGDPSSVGLCISHSMKNGLETRQN